MTREGAIGNLIHAIRWNDMPKKEALDMAIQALKQEPICPSHGVDCEDCPTYKPQEPCDDAISRDAVWDVMQELWGTSGELLDRLMALPPVNPQPKTGHWINEFDGCECSECGCLEGGYSDYCPNCGAKMIEPQES